MREGQNFQVADSVWLTAFTDSDMTTQCVLEIRNNSSVTTGVGGGRLWGNGGWGVLLRGQAIEK